MMQHKKTNKKKLISIGNDYKRKGNLLKSLKPNCWKEKVHVRVLKTIWKSAQIFKAN